MKLRDYPALYERFALTEAEGRVYRWLLNRWVLGKALNPKQQAQLAAWGERLEEGEIALRQGVPFAKGVINIVSSLNSTVKDELTIFIAEFYTKWADDIPGRKNFDNELPKVSRDFERLLAKYPLDSGEMADAFCLGIRQELNRIEDKATDRVPLSGPMPAGPTEVTAWFQSNEQAHVAAVVELLRGTLPAPLALEPSNSPYNRTLYFRHKIMATVRLYQYARELYEKNTPKPFARRPGLPSYYFSQPAALIVAQPTSKPAEASEPPTIEGQPESAMSGGKKRPAGTATGIRVAENIDAVFNWGFLTTHCDRLAKMLDLCPPNEDFEQVSNANTKIWALAKSIKGRGGQSYSAKTEASLARMLGARYGYTVSGKLTNVKENAELATSTIHLQDSIQRWKNNKEIS